MEESQMKRYVVVSSNNNPDYLFYIPYIEKAWNSLGWGLVVMVTDDVDVKSLKLNNPDTKVFVLPSIEGVRQESVAQAGRLYAANYFKEEVLLMTSDMDLLPLSDYWHPNVEDITVYGHDLTDYTYFPMGYTAMTSTKWKTFFNNMEADAKKYSHLTMAKDWEAWWNWDWRMLTDRLSPMPVVHKLRGRQSNGFAFGRIDRGNSMAYVEGELIDAHCENNNVQHPIKLNRFLEIFESKYGKLEPIIKYSDLNGI